MVIENYLLYWCDKSCWTPLRQYFSQIWSHKSLQIDLVKSYGLKSLYSAPAIKTRQDMKNPVGFFYRDFLKFACIFFEKSPLSQTNTTFDRNGTAVHKCIWHRLSNKPNNSFDKCFRTQGERVCIIKIFRRSSGFFIKFSRVFAWSSGILLPEVSFLKTDQIFPRELSKILLSFFTEIWPVFQSTCQFVIFRHDYFQNLTSGQKKPPESYNHYITWYIPPDVK